MEIAPVNYNADSLDAGDVGNLINLKQLKEVTLSISTLTKIFDLILSFKSERVSLQEEDSCVVGGYSCENNSIDLKFKYLIHI